MYRIRTLSNGKYVDEYEVYNLRADKVLIITPTSSTFHHPNPLYIWSSFQ